MFSSTCVTSRAVDGHLHVFLHQNTVQQQLIQVEREIGIVAKITGAEHLMAVKQEEKALLLQQFFCSVV